MIADWLPMLYPHDLVADSPNLVEAACFSHHWVLLRPVDYFCVDIWEDDRFVSYAARASPTVRRSGTGEPVEYSKQETLGPMFLGNSSRDTASESVVVNCASASANDEKSACFGE